MVPGFHGPTIVQEALADGANVSDPLIASIHKSILKRIF